MFERTSIRAKITAAILLTAMTVLFLTVMPFVVYEIVTHRQRTVSQIRTAARLIAENSGAAVAFKNEQDASDVLASLRMEPQVTSAALYDAYGQVFVTYAASDQAVIGFPTPPNEPTHSFTGNELILFQPIRQNGVRLGTVCVRADLRFFYHRLAVYGTFAGITVLISALAAILLSRRMERRISEPILALAGTTRKVSDLGDYSVRARKTDNDEVGLLTDAVNQMLTRIQEQTVALQQGESRLRLALEAGRIGTWDWNLDTGQITWDEFNFSLFGLKHSDFDGRFESLLNLVHPDDRESLKKSVATALREKKEFSTEYRVVWPDGSVHDLFGRGKARYDANGRPVQMNGVSIDVTLRKRSDEASRFLASIVESTEDAIVGKDLEGTVVSWNSGAERMFGYTAKEMIGSSIERITSPDRPDEEPAILADVKRGKTRSYETVRIRKDGTPLHISLTVSPIRTAAGAIVGVSSISRDISLRKRTENELEESRARLSGIIGSAMDAIISIDENQRITVFNTSAERMFRCSAADALGQPLDKFIPSRFRDAHRKHVEEFGKTGSTSRAMGHLRPLAGLRSDGEEFPIEASISNVELGGQKIFTVILRDITERIRSQEALERHARTLHEQAQMLDLANVMARDLEDRIILWNTGMEQMYGWPRTETLGRSAQDVLKSSFPIPLPQIKAILLREGRWEGEIVHRTKSGRPIIVASQWVLHRDDSGQPTAILEVNTDITARKEAERQMLRMNTELERRVAERTTELTAANQEMEAFTYSVAHDLRAPLRHIDAFTKILFEDFANELPSDARRYLENIRKGSQNMSRLVDDLLNLARVGRQELRRERTPLNSVVDEVITELRGETQNREIEWRVSRLPAAKSDPGLIKQVFTNLLSNAVKYTRPCKHAIIEVGVRNVGNESVIFVRDNGVGFNMKYADKLFGVFQRLHRADEFEGTGVGLAIVDRIIRRHGGRVWAESEVEKGAAFYFTLDGLDSGPVRN